MTGTDNAPAEQSETPAEQTAPETPTAPDPDAGAKKALETERQARREADKAAKALKAELDALKAAQMTDTEKAIAEAKAATRAEVLAEFGSSLVDAEFKAASAGLTLDLDALLDNLDRAKFLTEDGKPDKARIGEFVSKLAPAKRSTATDTGQGARKDGTGPAQITDRAVLQTMTPEQIDLAHREGRLKSLMGG